MIRLKILLVFLSFLLPAPLFAAELVVDDPVIVPARVSEVVSQRSEVLPGLHIERTIQTLTLIGNGEDNKGTFYTLENDRAVLEKGDRVWLAIRTNTLGEESISVQEIDRRVPLMLLFSVFVILVIFLSRWQGVRAIFGLLASIFIIGYVLVPSLAKGYPPVLAASLVAIVISIGSMILVHGWKNSTKAAIGGTVIAIVCTSILSYAVIIFASLSGITDDASVYLSLSQGVKLDLSGLLLGAMIIGVLGVLDDATITQAETVATIHSANPKATRYELYKQGMRVGHEHISALVNTLALAYTGAALPLLLLFSYSNQSIGYLGSLEIVSTEILRILVGSIGVVLAVPISTFFAAYLYKGRN